MSLDVAKRILDVVRWLWRRSKTLDVAKLISDVAKRILDVAKFEFKFYS